MRRSSPCICRRSAIAGSEEDGRNIRARKSRVERALNGAFRLRCFIRPNPHMNPLPDDGALRIWLKVADLVEAAESHPHRVRMAGETIPNPYAGMLPRSTAATVPNSGRGRASGLGRAWLAACRPAAGKVVVLDQNAEVGDLVAQGVAMNAEGLRRAAEVATVGFEGSDDELFFELPPGLIQGQASADELVNDLVETSVEVLFGQEGCSSVDRQSSRVPQGHGRAVW